MKYDRHELYEIAVQHPPIIASFMDRACRKVTGLEPRSFREDFCGTANLASTWVRMSREHSAVGVDIDGEVLRSGRERHIKPLGPAASRLRLIKSDVMRCGVKADIVAAFNFSYMIFKKRAQLLAYFRHARKCVKPGGIFICDHYGGPGAASVETDKTRYSNFTYIWDQSSFDPVTADVVNHIHFKIHKTGKTIRRAFTYEWRLWTLPELRDLFEEAGFREPRIFVEADNGVREGIDISQNEAWVLNLVAEPAHRKRRCVRS